MIKLYFFLFTIFQSNTLRLSRASSKEASQDSTENESSAKQSESKSSSVENVDSLKLDTTKEFKKTEAVKISTSDERKWFSELRQRMQTDDEESGGLNTSQPESQTSSVDGIFAHSSSKTTHPFRIIEHDNISIQSMMSLGRVGRVLSGIETGMLLFFKLFAAVYSFKNFYL